MRVPSLRAAVRTGRLVVVNFLEHRMGVYAAALAYRGLLCLFPVVLIVVVMAGALVSPELLGRVAEEAESSSQDVPQQFQPVVEQGREQVQPMREIFEQAQRQAGGGLVFFGVIIAMWSISDLASTVADAFNSAFGATEVRRGWKVFALSLTSGPLVAITIILAVGLMLVGPQLAERVAEAVGLREAFSILWRWLRFPVALVLLGVALTFVYRYGSAERQPYRLAVPGAVFAVAVWAAASVGFSVYLANFANYGVTYGSLGAAVGLLIYLYLSASIVLAGAELIGALSESERPDGSGPPSAPRRTVR